MGRYAVLDSRAEKPELELSSSGASLTTSAVKTRIRSWTTGRIENRCEHVGVADDAAQAVENIGDAVLIDPELPDEVPDERQTMERMAYKYNAHIMPGTRNPARDAGHSKNNTGATAGKHLLSQPSTRTQTPRAERRPPACRELARSRYDYRSEMHWRPCARWSQPACAGRRGS